MGVLDLKAHRIARKIKALGEAALRAGRLDELHTQLEDKAMQEEHVVYTVAGVAKLLKVTQESVRRWIRAGELDASKIGRGYRIDRPALERFWQARGGTRLFTEDAGAGD